MFEELRDGADRCDGPECDRPLPAAPALVFRSDVGERRAYECPCGAVTVTVARRSRAG